MKKYDDSFTLKAALKQYFKETGFGPKNYTDPWFKVKVGPIPFYFPNFPSRKKAVKIHDLHHVLTGYETTLIGEAEIGAWELGSGCKSYKAAWFLNSVAVMAGLMLNQKKVMKAFLHGRKSKNLYGTVINASLFNRKLGDLRQELLGI